MTAKLRAAAMAATPGPWSTRAERARPRAIVVAGTEQVADAAEHVHWTDSQCEANAAYIASASPDVVIALLDQLDALRAALGEALEMVESPLEGHEGEAVDWTRERIAQLRAIGARP